MLCTSCWRTARPDVRLEGSDRAELAAWLCGAVPGLLYCWWRHAGRVRVCPACGSGDLVREARAASRRRGEAVRFGGGRQLRRDPLRWPPAFATPRARLQHGGLGVALAAVAAVQAGLSLVDPTLGSPAGDAVAAGALAVWGVWEILRWRRARPEASPCRASDESGRALPIEALS